MAEAGMTRMISPKFNASKISPGEYEDWVDVYEDRVWGWHFAHAEPLKASPDNAGFALLMFALAYIEGYEIYRSGRDSDGKSAKFFRRGFWRIFSNPNLTQQQQEAIAEEVYDQLRCGLFHQNATRRKVSLYPSGNGEPLSFGFNAAGEIVAINVDPVKFLEGVVDAYRDYVRQLRDPNDPHYVEVKANFEAAWQFMHAK
jgi:hypothetical protein